MGMGHKVDMDELIMVAGHPFRVFTLNDFFALYSIIQDLQSVSTLHASMSCLNMIRDNIKISKIKFAICNASFTSSSMSTCKQKCVIIIDTAIIALVLHNIFVLQVCDTCQCS